MVPHQQTTIFGRRWLHRRRTGGVTLEAILTCPILFIASLAFFQFGPTMTVHHSVESATVEASREASKIPNFDPTNATHQGEIKEVVETILGVHGLTVAAGSGVAVIIEDSTAVDCIGDETDTVLLPSGCPAATTITDADEIKITVLVNIDDAPVPNVLASFGVDFSSKRYEISSISRRED